MKVSEKLAELRQKEAQIKEMGGEARVQKQHDQGKLSARERLDLLFDEGTFREIDMFVHHRSTNFDMPNTDIPSDGVVTGHGLVDGRPVFAFSQDFTARGGSLGEMHAAKICKVMDLAAKSGVPIVGINDSGGARVEEGVDALKGYGEIFYTNLCNFWSMRRWSCIFSSNDGLYFYGKKNQLYVHYWAIRNRDRYRRENNL